MPMTARGLPQRMTEEKEIFCVTDRASMFFLLCNSMTTWEMSRWTRLCRREEEEKKKMAKSSKHALHCSVVM
jgi:hypothetical protein